VQSADGIVESSNRIVELLRSLARQGVLLATSIPERRGVYTSSVLAVHRGQGSFDIDEVVPAVGNRHLAEVGRLQFSGRLAGAEIRAEVALLSRGYEGELPYFSMALPQRLWHLERRGCQRLQRLEPALAALTLPPGDGPPLRARVLDLSVDGVAFEVMAAPGQDADALPRYARGELIENAVLTLDGRWVLGCDLEIQHVRSSAAAGSTPAALRVGARLCTRPPQIRGLADDSSATPPGGARSRMSSGAPASGPYRSSL